MKDKLVIVESPAKARTLAKILGKGYNLKASLGHIRDLPKSQIGVDVENRLRAPLRHSHRQEKTGQ